MTRLDAYAASPDNTNPAGGVIVWWTPDCGYLHVATEPRSIGPQCPDRVTPPRQPGLRSPSAR